MTKQNGNAGDLGFERELWQTADALRSNMDAGEYKHVVLGLIFLKYISDAFEECYAKLRAERTLGADPEDPDEYRAVNIFWVPKEARWSTLKAYAKQPTIGKSVDDAMLAIERDNPSLKGVLPKDYAHPRLDKQRLGQLIDLVGNIGLGDQANRSKDILGRVYEYFLSQFASAEGKKGGQFYTPRCVVRLLVEMLSPFTGRVYDPCCGSGGMFVQSVEFVKAHATGNGNGGKAKADVSIFGQESNHTTWRLAKMNLAIRQIENNLGKEHADSFHRDLHPDLKADFVLANPPFNDSDWRGDLLKDDKRWRYGTPPTSNANFAWVQHFIHHLAPNGFAGFVLAQASLASESQTENEIRRGIIEDDLVDCIVTLPGKLFYSTPIPVCLWFLSRNKATGKGGQFRDRRGHTLFIDAGALGEADSRTHSSLTDADIRRIATTYHGWRDLGGHYSNIPGFCMSVATDDIRQAGYSLFPARYIQVDHDSLPDKGRAGGQSMSLLIKTYRKTLDHIGQEASSVADLFQTIESTSIPPMPKKLVRLPLGEILAQSDERLGAGQEPEILTCTERAGLILQRERFAKRVATEDTSKYKTVRRTDIVYNPYLLWAGAIDQCWIVDFGITSPAYEVLRVRDGWDPTLVGALIKSSRMIKMYDGISVGTIQRRRRAPVERFLDLQVELPEESFHCGIHGVTDSVQDQITLLRNAAKTLQDLMIAVTDSWLRGRTR